MNEFGGAWIETFSGIKFHFLNPQPSEIRIKDIAHALSLTCRFSGQCKRFYSVAEHSIRVAEIVPYKYKLQALLHDASEAYLPDLPRPMKVGLSAFRMLEWSILKAIWDKYLSYDWRVEDRINGIKAIIKKADNILLATEARDLMANTNDWATLPEPLKEIIKSPLDSGNAEKLFLNRFYKYSQNIV